MPRIVFDPVKCCNFYRDSSRNHFLRSPINRNQLIHLQIQWLRWLPKRLDHMMRVSLWANHYGNMIWSNLHLPWPFLPLFWRLNYNLTRLKTCGWSLNDLVEVLPWPLLYMNVKLFSFSGWMTMTEHMKCLKGHCKCRPCKLSTSNLWSILIQTGKCRPCKLLTSNSL
jgi:hypothetical protein